MLCYILISLRKTKALPEAIWVIERERRFETAQGRP
jgi:hypothetical protein